jgi:hypothetical protein
MAMVTAMAAEPLFHSRYLDPNAKRGAGDQHSRNRRPGSYAIRSRKANQMDRASPFAQGWRQALAR